MNAQPGDRLMMDGEDGDREAVILESRHRDGSPPYVVRWLSDGHISLVFPGPYARIVPVGTGGGPGTADARGSS